MDTRQIESFLTLARYRNFTQAARYLRMSQSALSRRIIALESELVVSLFDRTSRSVRLTSAGEVFRKEGEKLLHSVKDVGDMVREAGRGVSGHLKLGSLGSINHRVVKLIGGYHARYGEVHIDLERFNTTELTEALICGDLDLGFTFLFAVEDFEELEANVLCDEEFFVLVSKDSPYARVDELDLNDMRKERIILPHFVHPPFIEEFFVYAKSTSIGYADSMDALLLQVESGLGISLVPRFAIAGRDAHHNILVKRIAGQDLIAKVVLAWNRANTNPAAKQFIDLSVDIFPSARD